MKLKNFLVTCVAALAIGVAANDIMGVLTVDGAVANRHPQIMELQKKIEEQAAKGGKLSLDKLIEEHKLDKELLTNNKVTVYVREDAHNGVIVIDTPEGNAPRLFDHLTEVFNIECTKSVVEGKRAIRGTFSDGMKMMMLETSPSQVQIARGFAEPVLPFSSAGVPAALLAPGREGHLFTLTLFAPEELKSQDAMGIDLKNLKQITLCLTNDRPEAKVILTGDFMSQDAALQTKGMLDFLMFAAQQNPNSANLTGKTEITARDGKLTITQVIDKPLLDAIEAVLYAQMEQVPLDMLKKSAPAPAAE